MIPPDNILDFDEWFDSLKPYDNVTMIGKMTEIPMPSKNIKKSNVFNNDLEYEIELEYIGNNFKK